MQIKKLFYKLNKEEFTNYLKSMKESPNTFHFMNGNYFYNPDMEIIKEVLLFHALMLDFNSRYYSLNKIIREYVLLSLLVNEIKSTNEIENVFVDDNVIYYEMNNTKKDKSYIQTIISMYRLIVNNPINISTHNDIKDLYNNMISNSLSEDNKLDGEYYRKDSVVITNGIKPIHIGVNNEESINKMMKEFIDVYNNDSIEIIERMIISHFIFETIHPYYDGNGRIGRFLLVNGLYLQNKYIASLLISKILLDSKSKYYKSFEDARNIHEFGCLNEYVLTILKIINSGLELAIKELQEKIDTPITPPNINLTIIEQRIYILIKESTIFSNFGISNEQIIKELNISKRSLMYTLKKFKSMNLLEDKKIGTITYHRIK